MELAILSFLTALYSFFFRWNHGCLKVGQRHGWANKLESLLTTSLGPKVNKPLLWLQPLWKYFKFSDSIESSLGVISIFRGLMEGPCYQTRYHFGSSYFTILSVYLFRFSFTLEKTRELEIAVYWRDWRSLCAVKFLRLEEFVDDLRHGMALQLEPQGLLFAEIKFLNPMITRRPKLRRQRKIFRQQGKIPR